MKSCDLLKIFILIGSTLALENFGVEAMKPNGFGDRLTSEQKTVTEAGSSDMDYATEESKLCRGETPTESDTSSMECCFNF